MVFLFCLSASGQAHAQGSTWQFNKLTRSIHGDESSETITYSVNSEISKIEDTKKIIYIDYAKNYFYRYDKSNRSCLKFPFNSNQVNEPVNTEKDINSRNISLVSSFKVFTTTEHKEIAHYNCSLKHILFGADLAMFQMVAPLVVHEYGQRFTESMVGYCVSDDVVGLNTLFNIAQKRNDVFKNNPLLRQIDIVGLLEILDGFPVQITQKIHETDFVTTLASNLEPIKDEKKLSLPVECRK